MKNFLQNCSLLFLISLFFISAWSFKLNFNSEGEFTVLQFTDLHYGDTDGVDGYTLQLQRDMIAKVKPDLIVVSGDGVSGHEGYYFFDTFHIPNFFKKHWKKFTQAISEAGIPYAFTIGNHDIDGDLDRYEIAKLDMTHPLSVRKTSEGIPDTLNFYVPIYSSKNQDKLAANIWLFDSGSKGCMDHEDSWGCVEEHQIQWYEQESKKIKEQHGADVHHIAFVHIPPPEYMMLANQGEIYGSSGEPVSCPNVNSGFFDRVQARNDISAIFVGHDHFNSYGGSYNGIELVYGQKSGYGGYGETRGARVIKFKEDVDANGKVNVQRNHYVMYENGTVDTSRELFVKPGKKQARCITEPSKSTFRKLRDRFVFDYLLLAGEILLVLLGVYALSKIKCGSLRKQNSIHEFTEMSDEPEAAV